MGSVADNLEGVQLRIARACERSGRSPNEARLLVVTKTVPVPLIRQAISGGARVLGENRVQEAMLKYAPFLDGEDKDKKVRREGIELHMIGALQRNKARNAALYFDAVQSVDRVELADALERTMAASGQARALPVFLEVNVTGESAKSGAAPTNLHTLAGHLSVCQHLQGVGLMTVARLGAGERELRQSFSLLRHLLEELRAVHGGQWRELSMGMSDDYEIAVEEGATLVRLGRAIFGERGR